MEQDNDPVDLILSGELQQAADAYLQLYFDAILEGHESIGQDLCAQLLYIAAGQEESFPPEGSKARKRVMDLISIRASEGNLEAKGDLLSDHVKAAAEGIRKAKARSEKSIEKVEREKEMRWREVES